MLAFFTKLTRLSRYSFKNGRDQSEILFFVLQTSIVKTSIMGKIEILCLKIDMTCKIESAFYDSFAFIANISGHKNSKMLFFK